MKGKYLTIFAVLGLIVFFAIGARAVDWELIATSDEGVSIYYKPQSIKRLSNGIARVSNKVVYSGKGLQDAIKRYGLEYNELSHSIELYEFNCSKKKRRNLSATIYRRDGSVIGTFSDESPWVPVIPETVSATMFDIICGSR